MPKPEKILWHHLRKKNLGYKFSRQYGIGPYVVDFYCSSKKLVIELDGAQHTTNQNQKRDQDRTKFINAQGIKVIRFWNNQIFNDLDDVLNQILYTLKSH